MNRFASARLILAALEATVPAPTSSVLLSVQLLPDRLDGEMLAFSIMVFFLVLFMMLTAARWRVHRRLGLPGLKEVQAWERLANARAIAPESDAIATIRTDNEVRIVARVPGTEWAEIAAAAQNVVQQHGTVLQAVRTTPTTHRGSTVTDRIVAATIVPFADLRAARRTRIRRTQFWTLGAVTTGAAVAAIIISSM